MCDRLLEDSCTVLSCLGRSVAFELAIGVNGRVWVNSASPMTTIVITNAILNSYRMPTPMVEHMVAQLLERI